jgi:8-hydroxy-5-deazaflavin:NADPH oxidoreductase
MNIAVLGTGIVGRTLADGFSQAGHKVVIGTRDVAETMARSQGDAMGNPSFAHWHGQHSDIELVTLSEAASSGEVVVNATSGSGTLAALAEAGSGIDDKVLIDVANPLDFSQGMPPTLSVGNTDSLAEQIQRKHPRAKVVKSLNTMTAALMIRPSSLSDDHVVFVAGDDDSAKETVRNLLQELGWNQANIIDTGGIRSARGAEMYVVLWVTLMGVLGGPNFNIKLVKS